MKNLGQASVQGVFPKTKTRMEGRYFATVHELEAAVLALFANNNQRLFDNCFVVIEAGAPGHRRRHNLNSHALNRHVGDKLPRREHVVEELVPCRVLD